MITPHRGIPGARYWVEARGVRKSDGTTVKEAFGPYGVPFNFLFTPSTGDVKWMGFSVYPSHPDNYDRKTAGGRALTEGLAGLQDIIILAEEA